LIKLEKSRLRLGLGLLDAVVNFDLYSLALKPQKLNITLFVRRKPLFPDTTPTVKTVLVVQRFGVRKVTGSTPGRGAIYQVN